MEALTDRQGAVLQFIATWAAEHGVVPSYREIGGALGMRSTNAVSEHVSALQRKGYVEMALQSGKARALRLTAAGRAAAGCDEEPEAERPLDDRAVAVPVLGRIAAGSPVLAVEDHDASIVVDRGMLRAQGDVFALVVRGDSMIDDGIFDGDFVFLHRASHFRDGDVVGIQVDDEATVKRVWREGAKLKLVPSNREMEPFYADTREHEVQVLGPVVAVFRRM